MKVLITQEYEGYDDYRVQDVYTKKGKFNGQALFDEFNEIHRNLQGIAKIKWRENGKRGQFSTKFYAELVTNTNTPKDFPAFLESKGFKKVDYETVDI